MQREVIVQIITVTRHILKYLDERREVDTLLFQYALRLHHYQIIDWREKCVNLEELSLPDEALPAPVPCGESPAHLPVQ